MAWLLVTGVVLFYFVKGINECKNDMLVGVLMGERCDESVNSFVSSVVW